MLDSGATRIFRKARYPVAMGWQADLAVAVLDKLKVHALTKEFTGEPVCKIPAPLFEFPGFSKG
jgi:hypothetical protein